MRRLLLLAGCLSAASWPQEKQDQAQEFAVSVTMRSAMTIHGGATFGPIRISTDLGDHEIDPSKVRWLEFYEGRDQATLAASTMTGKIGLEDFTLRTDYGTFKIEKAKVRSIVIQGPWKAGDRAPVAVPEPRENDGPSNRLVPSASVLLSRPARDLFLVPDESALLLHDDVAHRLVRYDVATLKLDSTVVDVWKGFRGLRASADPRYILGFGAVEGSVAGGRLAVYEDQGRKPAWHIALDFDPIDVAASPRGRIFILGRNPAPLIAVVDPSTRKVASRWGGVPPGSRIIVGADGKRLYVASDEGASGALRSAWLTGPGYDDPLKWAPSPADGRTRVGSPVSLLGQGRFLASGSTLMRIADNPQDDLKFMGPLDACDSLAESPAQGLMFVSTRGATLKLLSLPDFVVRRSFIPGARLGEMRIDRKGRLFALTAPGFQPGRDPGHPLNQVVRYDLAGILAAVEAERTQAVPPPEPRRDPASIQPEPMKDLAGGRPVEPTIAASEWKPELKSAQPCPGCEGKGQVKIDREEGAGVILRRHQACSRCAGQGKADLLACEACHGRGQTRLVLRLGEAPAWSVAEIPCRRCSGAGLVGKPLAIEAGDAGKPSRCVACAGAGQVKMQRIKDGFGTDVKGDCLECSGKGRVIRTICVPCKGTGAREERITVEIQGAKVTRIFPEACGECRSTGVRNQAP